MPDSCGVACDMSQEGGRWVTSARELTCEKVGQGLRYVDAFQAEDWNRAHQRSLFGMLDGKQGR